MSNLSSVHPSSSPNGSETAARPKQRLFCECGRAAPPEEWVDRPGPDGRALVCPDCRTVLTVR